MIGPWAAGRADGANHRFCERCGSPAQPVGSLDRGGLRTCRACGIFACPRCWARSAGSCPACGIAIVATSLLRSVPGVTRTPPRPPTPGPAPTPAARVTRPRRPGRFAVLAAGAVAAAIAVVVLGSLLGRPAAPSGEVAGVVGAPGASGGSSIDGGPMPNASGSDAAGASPASPGSASHGGTGPDVAGEPGSTEPAPGATPTRTPRPQPTDPPPTPAPTPSATAAPSACGLLAPQLVGEHRNDASRIWSDAGFTGAVTALGHGNYVIASQTPAAGADLPCDAGVTIGPANG